ncbi:unnamed protein product [Rhizophagus irregularis]|nr:unnamed protein product [Rhizophagus irregularis]
MQDDVIPIIQKWSNIPENTPKAITYWPWKLKLTPIFPKFQNKHLDSQNQKTFYSWLHFWTPLLFTLKN